MLRHRPSRLACIGGKCPTKGRSLLSLRHSELECYLVVVRAIQHDRNKGNREAGPTESKTCACGGCQVACLRVAGRSGEARRDHSIRAAFGVPELFPYRGAVRC